MTIRGGVGRCAVGIVGAALGAACTTAPPPKDPEKAQTAQPVEPSAPGPSAAAPESLTPPAGAAVSIEDDLAFLKKHGDVLVLESPSGGRVLLSPKYQGRVMTSAVEPGGRSLGFVFRKFIEEGKSGTQFDNYGGEDRFWLGPEAGQYGLYFPKGKPFTISEWKTPDTFQTGTWQHEQPAADRVVFKRAMKVENYSGATFDLDVTRTVELVSDKVASERFGLQPAAAVKWVGFQTTNRVVNTGTRPWTKETGLLSVWILGMYNPSPDTRVVIPFEKGDGEIVNDRYFGKVPPERLKIDEKAGVIFFSCDGQQRGKIGVGPRRAKPFAGSYSASAKLLTIVEYDSLSRTGDYVNSMWETQKNPYAGDVVNSYNDGPTEPGKPSLGGFYELESSSPAVALKPKAAMVHVHRTYHFVGEPAALDPIAKKALGVTTADIVAAF